MLLPLAAPLPLSEHCYRNLRKCRGSHPRCLEGRGTAPIVGRPCLLALPTPALLVRLPQSGDVFPSRRQPLYMKAIIIVVSVVFSPYIIVKHWGTARKMLRKLAGGGSGKLGKLIKERIVAPIKRTVFLAWRAPFGPLQHSFERTLSSRLDDSFAQLRALCGKTQQNLQVAPSQRQRKRQRCSLGAQQRAQSHFAGTTCSAPLEDKHVWPRTSRCALQNARRPQLVGMRLQAPAGLNLTYCFR